MGGQHPYARTLHNHSVKRLEHHSRNMHRDSDWTLPTEQKPFQPIDWADLRGIDPQSSTPGIDIYLLLFLDRSDHD